MPYLPKPKRKPPTTRRKSSNSREDKRFLDSKPWKQLRKLQLQRAPYCEACMAAGHVEELIYGAHIDHIVRRADGGAPLDERNLQTLCREHHEAKNRLERWYGCLVEHSGAPGYRYPQAGEKEKLIQILIGNAHINHRKTGAL